MPSRFRALFAAFLIAAGVTVADAGRTLQVPAGGNLQDALNAAQPGDTILLEPGATYVGNFVLPRKEGDSSVITVRTAGLSDTEKGTRIKREASGRLARLQSPNAAPALATAARAHHWRLRDLEFVANERAQGEILRLGAGSQAASEVPHDLVLERLLIRGDETNGAKRGIALNSASTTVRDSYIGMIGVPGQDSQPICGWNGPGPFLIENNYLEGGAENIMFGGADPSIPGLVPSDITVRGNHLIKPVEWRTGPRSRWTMKNLFELKNARRVLIEANVLENSWRHGQTGHAVLFTVRNEDGRAPWAVVEDVTFQYNIVRHAGAGISILGHDNLHPSGQTSGVRVRHNLFYDIDGAQWGGSGRFILMGRAPKDIIIDHNTVLNSGAAIWVYGLEEDPSLVVRQFEFTNNILMHGDYGIMGEKAGGMGRRTIERYFPDGNIERNVLAGGPSGAYDGENYFPSVRELLSEFVDADAQDYRLRENSRFRTLGSGGSSLGADVPGILSRVTGVIDRSPDRERPRIPRR